MPFGSMIRDEWVERAAKLICIHDPLVKLADAELLAVVLWDRPLADVPDSTSTAVHTLDQLRHAPDRSLSTRSGEPPRDDLRLPGASLGRRYDIDSSRVDEPET